MNGLRHPNAALCCTAPVTTFVLKQVQVPYFRAYIDTLRTHGIFYRFAVTASATTTN